MIDPVHELLRPWKLASLALGVSLLLLGSRLNDAPDWDVGVSLIMAIVAYATAPHALRTIRKQQWKRLPLVLFSVWFGVDGCYSLYWAIVDPWALEQMRAGQWQTSLCLYLLCGLIWMHEGSLRSIVRPGRR